jgi:hypothetical protein
MPNTKHIVVKVGNEPVARFVVPTPRYTSLAQAVDSFFSISNTWRKNGCAYPCLACSGDGWYRKAEDRCPVEGYKMAPRYTCEVCQGTGGGTKEQFKAHYDDQVMRDKEKNALFQADLGSFIQTLSLLTPDQVKIMRKMLNHFDSFPREGETVKTIKVKS